MKTMNGLQLSFVVLLANLCILLSSCNGGAYGRIKNFTGYQSDSSVVLTWNYTGYYDGVIFSLYRNGERVDYWSYNLETWGEGEQICIDNSPSGGPNSYRIEYKNPDGYEVFATASTVVYYDENNSGNSGNNDLYIGVVAFNQDVRELALTNNLKKVKSFITNQQNDKDFTSFAYAVSKGNLQFDANGLPNFDNIFMLNFSDGTDNYSNMKWGDEGRIVAPNMVYDEVREDLLKRTGLNSYAIGFGDDIGFGKQMKKVVTGSGSYYNAVSARDLQPTFEDIAQAMLASAKNVIIKTNPGYYKDYHKYFRLKFYGEDGSEDVIYARMNGTPNDGYTLSINSVKNRYASFDAPARGGVNPETGKVHIPLNNLRYVRDDREMQFTYSIEVSMDGDMYYTDVEEASTEEEISKRIAIVLVLDCSTSMGDAFAPMKDAAIEFVKTIENL